MTYSGTEGTVGVRRGNTTGYMPRIYDPGSAFDLIIRRFFRDQHVVHVGLPQTGGRNPDEAGLFLHLGDCILDRRFVPMFTDTAATRLQV